MTSVAGQNLRGPETRPQPAFPNAPTRPAGPGRSVPRTAEHPIPPQAPTGPALHLQEPPTAAPAPIPESILQAQSIYESPQGFMRGGAPPLSPIIEPSVTPSMTSSPEVAPHPQILESSSDAAESVGQASMSRESTPSRRGPVPTAPQSAPAGNRPWYTLGSDRPPAGPQPASQGPIRRFVRAASRELPRRPSAGLETVYATPQFSPESTPGMHTPLSSGMQTPPRGGSQGQQFSQQMGGFQPIPYHRNERMPHNPSGLPPGEPLTDFEDGALFHSR